MASRAASARRREKRERLDARRQKLERLVEIDDCGDHQARLETRALVAELFEADHCLFDQYPE